MNVPKLANYKPRFTCLLPTRGANRVGDDVFDSVETALTFDSLNAPSATVYILSRHMDTYESKYTALYLSRHAGIIIFAYSMP
jgi:hypothetical protein